MTKLFITSWKEMVGILATMCVLASFTQSEVSKIRYINIVGCILFIVYGLLLNAFSVWFLNGACLILHIYKLYIEASTKKHTKERLDAKHLNR